MRVPAVLDRLGVSRTTLYRWMEDGHFPKPIRLGPNTIAWRASDLDQWLDDRAKALTV